jgi:hypothetical protein
MAYSYTGLQDIGADPGSFMSGSSLGGWMNEQRSQIVGGFDPGYAGCPVGGGLMGGQLGYDMWNQSIDVIEQPPPIAAAAAPPLPQSSDK